MTQHPDTRKKGVYCGLFALTVLAVLAAPAASASGTQVNVDYSFARPQVSTVTIGGIEYDRITMPGCSSGGTAGEPALPACGARILLPFGTEVSSIEVIGQSVSLGAGYLVEPLSRPVKLSDGPDAVVLPTPDPTIYEAPVAFPPAAFEEVGTQAFRGYQILVLKLHPVEYLPATGELRYYPNLSVVVDLEETGRASALLRGLAQDEQEVLTKVDNPAEVDSYAAAGVRGERNYDLLIITTSAYAATFQPLKNYHDANGVLTEIRTTTDAGGSDPDTIRAYITDCYNNDGISYAIIGGDDDILPAKNLYVQAYPGGDTETAMPGDLYVGCLDGTWNYDGDGYWGEPTDGPGGGDVDLVAEVYIGRACGGSTTEIGRFVTKTLWYLNGGHTQVENVLLVGEYLGFGGVSDYAANTLEQLIDGSSADGYTTVGIPSDQYVIDTLFERDGDWSQADLVARINSGVHLLDHLGHGSPDYAMKLYNSDVLSDLTNTDLCFVYSQTCLAGHFDGTDCWAEHMNIKTNYGGFGVVMNARYGWGQYNSTDGPSQRFNREYWDAVYGEGMMEMGRANQDSKEDNLYRINDDCGRWCYYELNLFGDPTVQFRGVAAVGFDYPGGIPETVLPGQAITIEVVVTPIGDGVPVAGSGQLHYSIDGGGFVTVDMVEGPPNHYEATLPALDCGSTIDFYFTAEETVNGVFSDPRDAPDETYSAVPITEIVTFFEDDFETDQGWTVGASDDDATTGIWNRMDPEGTAAQPEDDHTPAPGTECYVTDGRGGNLGAYDVDDGRTTLVTPVFDLTEAEDDHTPSGAVCWATDGRAGDGLGTYDVDDGKTTLFTPTFDLSEASDPVISYWRWYSNDTGASPNADIFEVDISDDGGVSWVSVEVVGPSGAGTNGGWFYHEFQVLDKVTELNADIKMRFVASDEGSGSLVEAAIDDFRIDDFLCEDAACFGDLDGDNDIDLADLSQLLSNYGMTSGAVYEDGDLDGDGDVDLSDLSALLAVYGTTCP